jgi:hypothetical protein
MDYFVEDNFITNLEDLTLIDNLNSTITFSNTVFIENSLNTSNIICESLLGSNIFSSSVDTYLITSDAATISNLSCDNVTSCNLFSSNINSLHSHVSFAFPDHYATLAIMQDAIILEHKCFTKYQINLVQHVHHVTLHRFVKCS